MTYALLMIVMRFFGTGTDNVAHTGGFIGGVLLDPRKAETGDHTLAAVDCLLLTVASIAASVVVPLSMR
jgi:membrane associated rhomboid family serine protease